MRYTVAVLSLALLPLFAVHVFGLVGIALFMMVAGTFALADGEVVLIGVGVMALSLLLLRLCWWMFQQKSRLIRTHRAILGGVLLALGLVLWAAAPQEPQMHKAVLSMAGLYGLFGLGLVVHAREDRWGA